MTPEVLAEAFAAWLRGEPAPEPPKPGSVFVGYVGPYEDGALVRFRDRAAQTSYAITIQPRATTVS